MKVAVSHGKGCFILWHIASFKLKCSKATNVYILLTRCCAALQMLCAFYMLYGIAVKMGMVSA